MSDPQRVRELRGQVALHSYESQASDFVRLRDDTSDEGVATIVRAVTLLSVADSDAFRHHLEQDDVDTLRLFAMRRTLQGRRSASPNLLDEAFVTYALLERLDEVPWESWLKTALHLARSFGADLEMCARRYRALATTASAARFDVAVESMDRVDSLLQCHVVEVTTSHGTGFIEMLIFRDTTTRGLWGAPKLGDNQVAYHPTTNLAQVAVTLADALDASTQFQTGPLGQDQLAAAMCDRVVSGSYLPSNGCVSFVTESTDASNAFTVFVAELPDDIDAAALSAAANSLDGQAAVADDRRLIVMSRQPRFDGGGEEDDEFDFRFVQDLARSALLDSTFTTWQRS